MSKVKQVSEAFASAQTESEYRAAKKLMGRLSIPEQYATVDNAIAACKRLRQVGVL